MIGTRRMLPAGSVPGQVPQPRCPRVPGVDDRRPGDDVVQGPALAAQQDACEPQAQEQEAQRERQRAHDGVPLQNCRDRSELRGSVSRLRGPVVLVDHGRSARARHAPAHTPGAPCLSRWPPCPRTPGTAVARRPWRCRPSPGPSHPAPRSPGRAGAQTGALPPPAWPPRTAGPRSSPRLRPVLTPAAQPARISQLSSPGRGKCKR